MEKKKTEQERKQELIKIIGYITSHTQYNNLTEISRKIKVSVAALSKWNDGFHDPYKISSYFLYKLLELRGWSLDRFIQYLEGQISYRELTQESANLARAATNLSLEQQVRLITLLSQSVANKLSVRSSPEFITILNQWFESQNLSLKEASRLTKILPTSRFQALLEGLRPTQRDLINLAVCDRFRKPDGSRYNLNELEFLVSIDLDSQT